MSAIEQASVPPLREIHGPSAIGGGTRRFFELLWLISVTEFRKTYYGTVLGYVWSLVRPALLFGVLLFVFTKIFRIGSDVPHYPLLLLMNIVLFQFFADATSGSVTSVVGQEAVVRKTQFPRLVIPLATVTTAAFNLLLNLIPVFIFILAFGVEPTWTWLLLPVLLLVLLVLTTAVAMLLSALYVRFRDLQIIWTVAAQVLFYASPVLYPFVDPPLPSDYQPFLLLNPLAPILIQARSWIIDPDAPGALATAGSWLELLPSIAIAVGICVLAVWIFNREAPRIAEEL